ncbi:myosin-4-like [Fopius arisanus]|uniref:Myosin-4-like n=1 Tax=Fopius arisanus TaxID=64838 RepID=A0A9R1T5X1_9HYME|nr:PREDICTED: myosin-4-like [Fopius arisanus]
MPRQSCPCVHHKSPLPSPAVSAPKLKSKCCHCKKNRRDKSKSSEKSPTNFNEPMAGSPYLDDTRIGENVDSSSQVKFNEPRKLKKNLIRHSVTQGINTEVTTDNGSRNERQNFEEQISKLTAENGIIIRECEGLKEKLSTLTTENESLKYETENLTRKLKSLEEKEERENPAGEDEIKRLQNVIRERENSLTEERNKLNTRILELTNTIDQQKKKISEMMSNCADQKSRIDENEKKLFSKMAEHSDIGKKLKSKCCECDELQKEIENLKQCLIKESKVANDFREEIDQCREDCKCELLKKEKLIENQIKNIGRFKNILHNNERISQQAAQEYECLIREFNLLRRQNYELTMTLKKINKSKSYKFKQPKKCSQCLILEEKINSLFRENKKILLAARYTSQKLCEATDEFQSQLNSEQQQHVFLMSIVKQKEEEIGCLKKEMYHMRLYH